jgi:hypothetical protein
MTFASGGNKAVRILRRVSICCRSAIALFNKRLLRLRYSERMPWWGRALTDKLTRETSGNSGHGQSAWAGCMLKGRHEFGWDGGAVRAGGRAGLGRISPAVGDDPRTDAVSALPLTRSDRPAGGIPHSDHRGRRGSSRPVAVMPGLPSIRQCRSGSLLSWLRFPLR